MTKFTTELCHHLQTLMPCLTTFTTVQTKMTTQREPFLQYVTLMALRTIFFDVVPDVKLTLFPCVRKKF